MVTRPGRQPTLKNSRISFVQKLADAAASAFFRLLPRLLKTLNHVFKRSRKLSEPRKVYPKEGSFRSGRILILLLIGLTLFGFFYSDLFKIDRVRVDWDRPDFYESRVDELLTQDFLGRNLWLTLPHYSQFREKLPPSVENFSVVRSFPKTIGVNLQTRHPLAVVSKASDDLKQASLSAIIKNDLLSEVVKNRRDNTADFLVDATGLVFAKSQASPSGLPRIIWNQDQNEPRLGTSLAGQILFNFTTRYQSLAAEQSLPPLLAIWTSGPQDLLVRSSRAYFLFSKDFAEKDSLGSLALILNKYSVEGKKLRKVDLRFHNPVVEFQQ